LDARGHELGERKGARWPETPSDVHGVALAYARAARRDVDFREGGVLAVTETLLPKSKV
jgi:hypothetical protein